MSKYPSPNTFDNETEHLVTKIMSGRRPTTSESQQSEKHTYFRAYPTVVCQHSADSTCHINPPSEYWVQHVNPHHPTGLPRVLCAQHTKEYVQEVASSNPNSDLLNGSGWSHFYLAYRGLNGSSAPPPIADESRCNAERCWIPGEEITRFFCVEKDEAGQTVQVTTSCSARQCLETLRTRAGDDTGFAKPFVRICPHNIGFDSRAPKSSFDEAETTHITLDENTGKLSVVDGAPSCQNLVSQASLDALRPQATEDHVV